MSVSGIAVSNHVIYIVPASHLKTCIQGPKSIIISLNGKNIGYYYNYSINYYTTKNYT